MTNPVLFRKRLIPDECIELKDDIILKYDDELIITSWKALHPKKDLHHGFSCYYLKDGIKVSKFLKEDGSLFHWYCDIISHEYDAQKNHLTIIDLLADVIVKPDGFVQVADLDELADAFELHLIDADTLKRSLRTTNRLLSDIYHNHFDKWKAPLDDLDHQ